MSEHRDARGDFVNDRERREVCGYVEYVRSNGISIFSPRMMAQWNALPESERNKWIARALKPDE
jgi:hypothetical protein